MSVAVHLDPRLPHEELRRRLYGGALVLLSPTPATEALCAWARHMIEEAFAPLDPLTAQRHLSVERFVAVCAPLKPRFIHHPRTRALLRAVVDERGLDPATTYLDVPRLRMVTSDGYLTSGVGYAHHPHRDTWYSAPLTQLNWWLPLWEMDEASAVAFHPHHWGHPVANDSREFDYYEWNAVGRAQAAQHVRTDTRKQPRPLEAPVLEPALRPVVPPGGVVLFSGAQLHSTVPNTTGRTRYSIDVRTVDLADLLAGRGAPNVDSAPRGTSLRDFRRVLDDAPVPEEVVARLDAGGGRGVLVYRPGDDDGASPSAAA
ncbi:MAG: phytanoyl-CoA dioxygenase family protein [Planctomycetes bacterium]|nr:phytanoyl-CoA dioxygenase family protein [Planctomycetota bacterium]